MKKEPLLWIFENLSVYFEKYKVLSEGELTLRIKECIQSLSDAEREELERNLKGDFEEQIFTSITSIDKISVFSPDLHTRINYQGEVFYCLPTHRYPDEALEEAFLRWARIRNPLSTLKSILTDFLERCNYHVKEATTSNETGHGELIAVKKDKTKAGSLHLFIFPSILSAPHLTEEHLTVLEDSEVNEKRVIAVPTEKTPAPFISFFREHTIGDTMVWVVDVARQTVNPFIGTSEDADIEDNFANPEQGRRAVSLWMRKMHLLD